jgi:DNA-binding transcriptional MerR regulator
MYTVKQISKMAGITPRTLHYYDEIGLLKPTCVGENGYRYYAEQALLRLQQILFYRELDMPLDDIRDLLGRPDFDVPSALVSHKKKLLVRIAHLEQLIQTVDETLDHLKGKTQMPTKKLFSGFSAEEQAQYEKEAMQMYDPETVKASNARWKGYSPEKKEAILEEGKHIYLDLVEAMPKGPASAEAQACIERWRKNMDYFWTPNLDQLQAISGGYVDDPRFKATFDAFHPDLAEFIRDAVKVYVDGKKEK